MSSYHRQPHPDLPAIPEEAHEAPTPVEAEEEEEVAADDDVDDSLSLAESYANSYAFTLDNVGFDEESSLCSGVLGSVVGSHPGASASSSVGGGSVLHTPPAQTTPERISRHERRLHRETCRTLGLPYSEDTLDSSPSSRGDLSLPSKESVLGSISVSGSSVDASRDETERKRKMDRMWPWPTRAGSPKTAKADSDAKQNQSKFERMKEAMASFNERVEEAYQRANAPPSSTNQGGQHSSSDKENSAPPTKAAPRTLKELLQMRRDNRHSYREDANPTMTKLTMGTTILFMLLCIIVILATVAVSNQDPHPSLIDDAPDVTTHHDLDILEEWGGEEVTIATSTVPAVVVVNTTKPTTSPSAAPTASPFEAPVVSLPDDNDVVDESCIDGEGKFRNAQGRRRKCEWLASSEGELTSDRLDEECGANEGVEASELGLKCGFSCRAYNGCQPSEEVGNEEAVMAAGDDDEDAVQLEGVGGEEAAVMKVREAPDDVTPFPTEASTNPPSKSPSRAPVEEVTVIPTVPLPTFTDTRGRERQCWWLDIRNANQKQIRRSANCILTHVQVVCPESCVEYLTLAVMNEQALSHPGGFTDTDEGSSEGDGGDAESGQITTSQMLRTSNPYEHHHDPLPQDECFDHGGYYVSHEGQVRQCSWLIDIHDATDETRRIRNCGYPGSEYPEATDLGRMCKSTCGTCSL